MTIRVLNQPLPVAAPRAMRSLPGSVAALACLMVASCGGDSTGSPWGSDAVYGEGAPGLFGADVGAGSGGGGPADGGRGAVEDGGRGTADATDRGRGRGRGGSADGGASGGGTGPADAQASDLGPAADTSGGGGTGTDAAPVDAAGPDALPTDTGGGGGGLEPHALLCSPCKTDAQCGVGPDGTPAVCLELGPEGSFCTSPCDPGGQCPSGYACEQVPGPAGPVFQCVLEGQGDCPCSAAASAAHNWTGCEVDVGGVGCPGVRGCASSGLLTPCAATGEGQAVCAGAQPDPCDELEICDGIDNDCDGVTDSMTQPCASGCGQGTQTCVQGTWQGCTAPAPVCLGTDPCCASDGCSLLGPATKCGASPTKSETLCQGTCGGSVTLRERWAYCDGASGACGTGNLQWEENGAIEACGGGNLCKAGAAGAACEACPNGCSGSACSPPEPSHVVCIDPGYGGSAPGPVGSGLVGKDVTWSIAQHLKAWLAADSANSGGGAKWTVVMTRGQGDGPTNAQRAATCNAAGAERVISIFTNACCGGKGAETYHHPSAGGTTKTYAGLVQAQVVAHGGVVDRGVKASDFTLLAQTSAPAVMTFVGFIYSSVDGPKLASDAWRQEVALGLLQALQASIGAGVFTP